MELKTYTDEKGNLIDTPYLNDVDVTLRIKRYMVDTVSGCDTWVDYRALAYTYIP